ncbi:ras association domain-containing protein 9 [Bufo gargarizans]|uniref:ras association domain-containing protein 9 n=1 Tax=Bufo gargarizans TaxID=30331 RepID=UPI001CF41A23|nr:ras association domain-containing protein 9 [Bufo gargarizans]
MDHVKKKLLKTSHKTSASREEINDEDRQINVWIGQEEKIVCGLTKHTTSEDVVEALLEEYQISAQNHNVVFGSHKEYSIMERWKSFNRILPPTLKILKLLNSWGVEHINVTFFLFKTCTLYPFSTWWTSKKIIDLDKCRNQHNAAFHVQELPLVMRKKIVRKAFRKLQKVKKDMTCPKENNIEQMIHVVMCQNNIIKQQMDRMKQVDSQLEEYDSCQMGCHGENVSCIIADSADRFPEMHNLENGMDIQEKLNYQHMLIRKLSDEIKMEMSSLCQEDENFVEEGYTDMEKCVKQEIDESLQVGLQLNSLYNYMQKEIQYHDSILLQQKKEYEILKDELKSGCGSSSSSFLCYAPQQYMSLETDGGKELCEITHVLSSMDIQNETDSDTGISSTHSQDSESVQ